MTPDTVTSIANHQAGSRPESPSAFLLANSANAYQHVIYNAPHLRRSRTSSGGLARTPSGGFARTPSGGFLAATWSDERQACFEELLIKLTAAKNLPFSWIDCPEWKAFTEEFIPAARPFSRKVFSDRILNNTLTVIRQNAKKRAKGTQVTLQSDGWTGGNYHHFQAFMMTSGRREVSAFLSTPRCAFLTYNILIAIHSPSERHNS